MAPHHILPQTPKRQTRSLNLAEAPEPPSNPPAPSITWTHKLEIHLGSLSAERLREGNTRTQVTQHMGIKQCLPKFPFPFTPRTPLPSQLYNSNFYWGEVLPAWKS